MRLDLFVVPIQVDGCRIAHASRCARAKAEDDEAGRRGGLTIERPNLGGRHQGSKQSCFQIKKAVPVIL